MTQYEDLEPCDYFGIEASAHLIAIGWLAQDRTFTMADVSEAVFEKLCRLSQDPWCPVVWAGVHYCEFCRFTGGNGTTHFKGYSISGFASSCLFVPGDGFLFVAPTSIAHMIDAHGYRPPEAFCEAVLRCPEMRTVAYLKAVLANGGRGLGDVGR